MKPLVVFSAFDGAGIGLLALKRAGIPVEKYYASEVDKYAIQIATKNHPEIIPVGDVKHCWARNFPRIDLLIGGSPCQDLSIAKSNREGLKGSRSSLFWHFVRLLRTMKPRYFLLENVASMSKEDKAKITEIMGVEPILINSALVSAQQRKRLYWTNISVNGQPEDKGILLKDILERGVADRDKARAVLSSAGRTTEREFFKKMQGTMVAEPICVNSKSGRKGVEGLQPSLQDRIYDINGKMPSLTSIRQNVAIQERLGHIVNTNSQANRVYSVRGKSISLDSNRGGAKTGPYKIDLPDGEYTIRKLTPVECERLQTWPDGYTNGVSNTQRYKMLGNGWTADVIAHIFKGLEVETK